MLRESNAPLIEQGQRRLAEACTAAAVEARRLSGWSR